MAYGISVRQLCPVRSCPVGMFCPIDTNCAANTSRCVIECPTESDIMVQGNWSSGNCERSKCMHCIHIIILEITI